MKNLIRPKTNYSIVSSSDYLRSVTIRKILQENEKYGIVSYPNIFKPYFVVSDTEIPGSNKWVIALVPREGFECLDVDKDWIDLLFQIEGIKDKSLHNYLMHNTKINRLSLENRYKLFLAFGMRSYTNDMFDVEKADKICNKYLLEYTFNYSDMVRNLVIFLNAPTHSNFMSLYRLMSGEKHGLFVSILEKLLNDDISALIVSDLMSIINNPNFKKSILSLSIFLVKNNSYNNCIVYLMSLVKG